MKKIASLALALVLVTGTASAQYKKKEPAKPAAKPANNVNVGGLQPAQKVTEFRRITRDEAFRLYKAGQAVFIDVRSFDSFKTGHIKGALSIPGSQLISRFDEVTPGKMVITYCACDAEQSSGKAALNLMAHGVKNVAALKGGWHEWKAAGLPGQAGPR
jgi:rhodanese-related sulfurtransferase